MTLILLEVDQYSFNNENFRILELSRVVVVTHSQARYSDLEKKIWSYRLFWGFLWLFFPLKL